MEKKNKGKKIIILIVLLLLAISMAVVIYLMNMPEKEYENVYLESMEFEKEMENVAEIYEYNGMAATDENGRKVNICEELSYEKHILDNKVGMYDFSIVSDFEESKLTFVIKNHTKETIEAFPYRLQFLNVGGSIMGTIDLESKELPPLAKYKVTVNINSDVVDIYNIIPSTDFNIYGALGGEYVEKN